MPNTAKRFYEFGPFRLDAQKHRLLQNGELVHLSRKALKALTVFVQHPNEMLEREALMQAVWADTFVEDANLTVAVSQLRKVLGRDREGAEYLETVPGVGYRFVADVREVREQATPLIIEKRTISRTVIEEDLVPDTRHTEETSHSILVRPVGQRLTLPVSRAATVSLLAGAALLAVALSAASYFGTSKPASSSESAAISSLRSIAVLPPKSLSGEADASLSLGMADALITRLGSVGRLPVRPTSAVARYLDSNQDPVTAGRALGVDAVLDGTLQRDAGGMRLTLRLINVANGMQLWSGHFDEASTDIFKMQDDVSQQVGEALFAGLSMDDRALLTKRLTTNAEAYSLYLKGNYFWNKRNEEASKSLDYFRRAIELDPYFAQAHAALAAVNSTMGNPSPEAEALIEKTLKLDNTLADAHATYGFIRMFQHWDWPAAEKELDLAIELDPNSVTAHHWKGVYLSLRGRLDEAKVEMHRALELDPLSLIVMADLGQLHYFAHEYDRAIDYCNRALALDSHFSVAYEYLFDIYRMKGMDQEALNAWIKRRYADHEVQAIERERRLFARSGLRGIVSDELDSRMKSKEPSRAVVMGRYQFLVGNNEDGIRWLQRAFEEPKTHWNPYLNVDPVYDGVRNDPRFKELLHRMNLP
jgi:DNA-binding winged helix-turn-helix (wHTH) protein/TolB-like protein/Tfp pilus assembly protein PilF